MLSKRNLISAMMLFLANTSVGFGMSLDPGITVVLTRLDPTDPSLAGVTQNILNSNFVASPSFGTDDVFTGSFLSQAIMQSDDGVLAFHYQFMSTGAIPIYVQNFTVAGFNSLATDVAYLGPADESQTITATRSVNGGSITFTWANGPSVPIVIRTDAGISDLLGTASLSLDNPAGPGAPPLFFTASPTVVEPARGVGGSIVPEPNSLITLALAIGALAGRIRFRR